MKKQSKRQRRPLQLELPARTRGGARKGAGRKRVAARAQVPHVQRAAVRREHPVHVTLRVRDDVPNLRRKAPWSTIVSALRAARGRFGMRVIEYAILGNHLHLLVECDRPDSLSRGMRGLATRFAMRLNKLFGRRGRVFADRYHARSLRSPLEVRNGLCYVLLNARRHAAERGTKLAASWLDKYSSGARFDGWRETPRTKHRNSDFGTLRASTWLLRLGWRRHGLLALDEVPGGSDVRRTPAHQRAR